MQETSNALGRLIDSVRAVPGEVFEFAKDGAKSMTGAVSSAFGADNLLRAILPPVLGDAAANFVERRRNRELDTDDSDIDGVESDSATPDIDDQIEEIGVDVEDLADAIHEGFDDTNENLNRIFEVLKSQEKTQESDTKTTFELVGVNGQILKSIEKVEKNTTPNELTNKLKQHNEKKDANKENRERLSDKIDGSKKRLAEGIGSHLASKFLAGVGETFIGTALAGGVGAALMPKILSKVFGKKAEGVVAGGGLTSKIKDSLGALKTSAAEKLAAAKPAAATAVGAVKTTVSDGIASMKPTVASTMGAVGKGAKAATDGVKSFGGAAKNVASKFLGVPLMAATVGYQAYDIASSDADEKTKQKEYAKLAGGTGGMLVGAKVGAALGALTGPLAPIAVPVLGILGGALGYFGGEKAGEAGNDLVMGDKANDIKDKLTQAIGGNSEVSSLKGANYASVSNYSPLIRGGDVVANQSKTSRLENLSQQIEAINADNGSTLNQTTIVPVHINNPPPASPQRAQQEQKTFGIPATRNQDGTIQRLLDDNFTPMFR